MLPSDHFFFNPMNLKREILKEHSKRHTLKIANSIGNSNEKFSELIDIFFNGSYILSQRSSWIISHCADSRPELIKPYLDKMISRLGKPCHDAVIRNTLRIFQTAQIPEKSCGNLADYCFKILSSQEQPVAIRTFAMTVLYRITEKYPELKNELRILIQDQMPYSSPAFTSRGKKILKKLDKPE
jgi:hypothetical protein